MNQRLEGVNGKDLVQINTTANAYIQITGRVVGGTANSIFRKIGGSTPRFDLNLDCTSQPAYWLLDDTVPSNTVPANRAYGSSSNYL